ncbi:hypothetical protein FKP32DRAFT_288754 [Trametes sanguinea]|nr:hypothetical protein FKP32DRAFT_288754 [Trametes sanguinea]
MMNQANDPEAEFWKRGTLSQEARFLLLENKSTRLVEQRKRDEYAKLSPTKHAANLHDTRTNHDLIESVAGLSAVARGKQPARDASMFEEPEYDQESSTDSDSADESIVEDLVLDTSDFQSQDAASESISSASATSGKKRTVPYDNTFGPSSEPVTPSKKIARLARQSSQVTTSTSSLSSSASDSSSIISAASGATSRSSASAMRLRLIEETISSLPNTPQHPGRIAELGSPTPYRTKVESPTINKICDSLDGSVGLGRLFFQLFE